MMGLPRSGKSSIIGVVFMGKSPTETLFLETTNQITKQDVSQCSFVKYEVWDLPGHLDAVFQSPYLFSQACAIVFVIDAQLDYMQALQRLSAFIDSAYRSNPNIKIEVFIHKVDCLTDDRKIEVQRDITQRVGSVIDDLFYDCQSAGLHNGAINPINIG
ncbi:unnamed protein product [Protopolystoma xenopodis]|uniref:GTP-binding protein n=1 Tax=Protopolystoma xenopodis TaxID=117903 RepID=A0A3S5AGQ1_9PLAT|nr:unnamed protein product [Protopolystoma xenopodis]